MLDTIGTGQSNMVVLCWGPKNLMVAWSMNLCVSAVPIWVDRVERDYVCLLHIPSSDYPPDSGILAKHLTETTLRPKKLSTKVIISHATTYFQWQPILDVKTQRLLLSRFGRTLKNLINRALQRPELELLSRSSSAQFCLPNFLMVVFYKNSFQ